MQPATLLARLLRDDDPTARVPAVDLTDVIALLIALGFRDITRRLATATPTSRHRIFARVAVDELVHLQVDLGAAKHYQLQRIATLIRRYELRLEDDP